MQRPLLSIITITYQDAKGLAKTLESVQQQTCRCFEHIVVDGGSTDGTKDILAAFMVDKCLSEPDRGIYDAMNKGLAMAEGEWVIFLNGGDEFAYREVLAKVKSLLERNSSCDFLYGDYTCVRGGAEYKCPAHSHRRLWWGQFTSHQAMFFKNEHIVNYRLKYDMRYKIAADYKFVVEYFRHVKKTIYINMPVARFDLTGISNSNAPLGREEALQIRRECLGYGRTRCLGICLLQILTQFASHNCGAIYRILRGYKACK